MVFLQQQHLLPTDNNSAAAVAAVSSSGGRSSNAVNRLDVRGSNGTGGGNGGGSGANDGAVVSCEHHLVSCYLQLAFIRLQLYNITCVHMFCDRSVATLRPQSHFSSKYKGPSSMDCRERGSHAAGVYPTQDTSRMETVSVKQKEEADTRT